MKCCCFFCAHDFSTFHDGYDSYFIIINEWVASCTCGVKRRSFSFFQYIADLYEDAFADLTYYICEAWLDDLIVYGTTKEEFLSSI